MEEINKLEIEIQELDAKIEELNRSVTPNTTEDEYEALQKQGALLKGEQNKKIKELKKLKKASIEHTSFYYLPLGFKIHFILVCILYFPLVSWSFVPLWKYIVSFGVGVLSKGLLNLVGTNSFLNYLILGFWWYIMPIISLIIQGIYLKLFKEKENRKAIRVYYFISLSLILMLLIYEILMMIIVGG